MSRATNAWYRAGLSRTAARSRVGQRAKPMSVLRFRAAAPGEDLLVQHVPADHTGVPLAQIEGEGDVDPPAGDVVDRAQDPAPDGQQIGAEPDAHVDRLAGVQVGVREPAAQAAL